MKKTAILLFFIFFLNLLFGQNYTKIYSSLSSASSGYYCANKSGSYATNDNGSVYTSKEGSNLNVVKLNNTGCIEWSLNYDFGTNAEGSVIKQLLDNNFLVCGTVGDETVAMKIDGVGNVLWVKKYDLLYGTPLDFAQKGGEVILLAGDGIGGYNTNSTLIKIDETNGNLISSKSINRIPVDVGDLDPLCRFTRILTTGSGYVLGGLAIMNKYITDPLLPQDYRHTPIMVYLDMAGNVTTGNYFSEGNYVKEIIQQSGGVFIVAIENNDYRYIPTIVNSTARLTIFKVSTSSIWWQKTYVPPFSPISQIANQFPNNMEFTITGDILVTGSVDRFGGFGVGNYIFKIDTNGNLLSNMFLFNNLLGQASTGLKITPTNEFVLSNYSAGIRRFTSNITTSLCDYISIPLDAYVDTVTDMFPLNVVEIATPINAITVAPLKTTTFPIVTTLCGTACSSCSAVFDDFSNPTLWSHPSLSTTIQNAPNFNTLAIYGGTFNFDQSQDNNINYFYRSGLTISNSDFKAEIDFKHKSNGITAGGAGHVILALNDDSQPFFNSTSSAGGTPLSAIPISLTPSVHNGIAVIFESNLAAAPTGFSFKVYINDGGTITSVGTPISVGGPLVGGTSSNYFLQLIRVGSSSGILNIYSDAARTLLINTSGLFSIPSTIINLNTVQFGTNEWQPSPRMLTGKIDNLCIDNTIIPLSIDSIEKENDIVKIFPNPTQNILYLKSNSTILSIQIIDINGRIIQSSFQKSNEVTLKIENIDSGIYVLKVMTENGISARKIIKK